jgi:hypothetical protein
MSSEMQPRPEGLADSATDPFDELLTLEDTLYTSAYDLGVKDGARAGRIEGRIFGLEKGFEKFAAMGVLHGRSCVWGGRLPSSTPNPEQPIQSETSRGNSKVAVNQEKDDLEVTKKEGEPEKLPLLPNNPRLEKHISLLHGLTDPSTFSTENTEEAVADFDDRFKRAGAKAKVIERIIGELDASTMGEEGSPKRGGRGATMKLSGEGKKQDNMEDFAGSRLLA